MRFHHAPEIWEAHPSLAAGVLHVDGVTADAHVEERLRAYAEGGRRLAEQQTTDLPSIDAWRRAFAAMGVRPTQYRCAAESLLRRLRRDGSLPRIHPLVDLCNHLSVSTGIPVGVFDVTRISGDLVVRRADGTERYETFSGGTEHPAPGEVVFADDAGQAHSRRWTNRQSASSAVRDRTTEVLVVVEALHDGAAADVDSLLTALSGEIASTWQVQPETALLSAARPAFGCSRPAGATSA